MSSGMPDIPTINWFYYIISPSSINSICSFGMFFDIICCLEQSYLSRQDLCAKLFAGSGGVKSVGNRDVIQSRLQMLPVHVFLAAPLGFAMWRAQTSIRETNLLSPACVVPM